MCVMMKRNYNCLNNNNNNNNFLFKSGVFEDIAILNSRFIARKFIENSNFAVFIHFMQIMILTLSLLSFSERSHRPELAKIWNIEVLNFI